MTFKLAGARAQVCKYCRFLVARTDRGLARVGHVADLVEIPSPLQVGATGTWNGRRFEVEGRVQLDRVGAASAPWQEFYVGFPERGDGTWVAYAQGRWYATQEVVPTPQLPPLGALRPGLTVAVQPAGQVTVAEVGRRRVVSAEGELPSVMPPGGMSPYADFGAAGGVFGTFDYGDGVTVGPKLYLGRQFDPATFRLDSGQPLEAAKAEVAACTCPNCGGSLPLVTPGSTERIVCRYCGTVSDVNQGALRALGQAPRPPVEPYIPLGQEGTLRQMRVICIGFVIRGTTVEGERYRWREYLLYAGPSVGYLWLMEEDGKWQLVRPLGPGEVQTAGMSASFRGAAYVFKQSVRADVEYVVGEFYWKVEIGESVEATEYQGPGGIVSVERDAKEINTSFCEPLTPQEIGQAFGIAPPPSPSAFAGTSSGSGCGTAITWIVIIAFLLLFIMASDCEGGGTGGGVYIGPGFSGK